MVTFHSSMLTAVLAFPPVPIEHLDAEFAPSSLVWDCASRQLNRPVPNCANRDS